MSEQPGPPQEEERERRDVEFVRRAMELYCAGFKARQLKEPPEKMLESGRKVRDKHHSWAHEAGEHVPATFEGKPIAAHDRERFVAGGIEADSGDVRDSIGARETIGETLPECRIALENRLGIRARKQAGAKSPYERSSATRIAPAAVGGKKRVDCFGSHQRCHPLA